MDTSRAEGVDNMSAAPHASERGQNLAPEPTGPWSRAVQVLGLILLLAAFVWSLQQLQPEHLFGQFHDATIFMSSARALAAGDGYRLPSIPQTPAQTKHPIFYPWLLSLVWYWNPNFPANLGGAVILSAGFGCMALLATYFLLRTLGVSAAVALGIAAFCGLHPVFLQISARVMSDVPMMGLMLAAAVVAGRALRPRGSLPLAGDGGPTHGDGRSDPDHWNDDHPWTPGPGVRTYL